MKILKKIPKLWRLSQWKIKSRLIASAIVLAILASLTPFYVRNELDLASTNYSKVLTSVVALEQQAKIQEFIKSSKKDAFYIVAITGTLFFVVISILLISLWITLMPDISILLKATQEFKKGNLNFQVHIKGTTETALLGRAFNEMAVSIKSQNEKFFELNQVKSDFVSTVSHELRTPLTAIRGSIGLISGGALGEVPLDVSKMLKIAETNTDRLIRLINDVLDIAKIEAGAIRMNFKKLSLVDLIEHSLISIRTIAEAKGIKLKWNLPKNLPVVVADGDRIEQVITNLLSNAIKFSDKGGTVELFLELENEQATLHIKDYGTGIPDDFADKVFQKFQRSEPTAHKATEGTGLGLTICKAIIEEHGGKIAFQSQQGQFTDFYFSIPWDSKEVMSAEHSQAA